MAQEIIDGSVSDSRKCLYETFGQSRTRNENIYNAAATVWSCQYMPLCAGHNYGGHIKVTCSLEHNRQGYAMHVVCDSIMVLRGISHSLRNLPSHAILLIFRVVTTNVIYDNVMSVDTVLARFCAKQHHSSFLPLHLCDIAPYPKRSSYPCFPRSQNGECSRSNHSIEGTFISFLFMSQKLMPSHESNVWISHLPHNPYIYSSGSRCRILARCRDISRLQVHNRMPS